MNRPSKDASRQLQQHQQRRQEEWNKDGPESLLRAIPLAGQALSAGPTPLLISSMIDLREVCRLSLLCRATREAYGRRSRKACLTKGVGVPDDRRLEYWKCVLNVQKARCHICSENSNTVPNEDRMFYWSICYTTVYVLYPTAVQDSPQSHERKQETGNMQLCRLERVPQVQGVLFTTRIMGCMPRKRMLYSYMLGGLVAVPINAVVPTYSTVFY